MRLLRVETPLGLFALLWALAATLHHLEGQPLAGLPLYPFAILLFLYPERLWAMMSFACVHAALLSLDLPAAANHSVLALLVNGCLLIGGMQVLHRASPRHKGGSSGSAYVAPCKPLWLSSMSSPSSTN